MACRQIVAGLKRAFQQGELCLPGGLKPLAQDKTVRAFLRSLFRQDWVVYAKPPFVGGPMAVTERLTAEQIRGESQRQTAFVNTS